MESALAMFLRLIREERERQDQKWGVQNHSPEKWMVIIGEEFGESCKEALEGDVEKLKEELIQTAASCVAALESIERNQVK